jgi:exodeoxyribonuclease V alpha subunit
MKSDPQLGFLDDFIARTIFTDKKLYSDVAKLIKLSREGNLCVRLEDLSSEMVSFPMNVLEDFPSSPIVRDQERFYLQKNWVYETLILKHIQRLKKAPAPHFFNQSTFEKQLNIQKTLNLQQMHAIRTTLHSCLTLICGGPGTGKTYTAAKLVELLLFALKKEEKKNFRICLSAPTGKAAAHLTSALLAQNFALEGARIETATLHRLLKIQPGENRLFSNRAIDADLVIVDEASMIDVSVLAHLLESISDTTLLVLMGDSDQLPPVESASLFSEMASSFGVFLEKSLRTEEAHLQNLAKVVRQGDEVELVHLLKSQHSSLAHLVWNFDASLSEKLIHEIDPILSWEKPDPKQSIEKYGRFRILNALRQGPFGVNHLNEQIFKSLKQKQQRGQWWAIPILVTVNDSRLGLYNGTSGVLVGQNLKDAVAYFLDDSKEGVCSFSMPPTYEIAFCLSIHKSQGSEFEEVLALFPEGSENFGREALYTAVTRSKKVLRIVGKEDVLKKMLGQRLQRQSGLLERMRPGILKPGA